MALTPEDGGFEYHEKKGSVICPKPMRFGVHSINMPIRSLRLKLCQRGEKGSDSNNNAGATEQLLDIIQNHGEEEEEASSPHFPGSPPVRASNPLIQDAQFQSSTSAISSVSSSSSSPGLSSSPSSPPSSPLRKGGCVRMKFGIESADVRVVGFDCNVPAVAY